MALKDLLNMTKTDRYTADGRDKINELQAKVTEDVRYKTGDISQKTGLQKQPDGSWAPPKKGGKPAAKKEAGGKIDKVGEFMKAYERGDFGKYQQNAEQKKAESFFKENKSAAQEEIGKFYTKFDDAQSAYDAGRSTFPEGGYKIYKTPQGYKVVDDPKTQQRMEAAGYEVEADVPEGTKPPKSPAFEKDFDDEGESAGTNWQEKVEQNPRDGYNFEKMIQHRIPTSQTDKEELKGLRSFMNEEKATYQNALKSRAQALVDGHKSNGDWYPEKEQAIMKIAKAVGFDEELHKFIEEENRGYDLGYSEDAAPKIRELTGDCKIKIRPETQDVKYKTGDISQKTGLQKQPDGSWAPPKKGANKSAGSKPKVEPTPQQKAWADNMLSSMSNPNIEDYIKTLREHNTAESNKYPDPEQYADILEEAYKQKKEKNAGWMKELYSKYGDVIEKNPKLKKWFEIGRAPRLRVKNEGTYLGEEALGRVKEIQQENRRRTNPISFTMESMELDETNAKNLLDNYTDDSAPRQLTGDTKIRIRK